MTVERTTGEAWYQVGRQFQALGESLATAFRTAWESEENREHLQDMKAGLEAMVDKVGRAVQEANASPEAQKARREVEKAAESLSNRRAAEDAKNGVFLPQNPRNDRELSSHRSFKTFFE